MDKKQAAKYLNVSTRAIERYTSKGKLTPTYEQGRTGPAPTFDAVQLDKLREEMLSPVPLLVRKNDKRAKPDKSDGTALVLTKKRELAEFVTAIEKARAFQPTVADLAAKPLLKLKEVQTLTGLSRDVLVEAIKAGKLKAKTIGRAWRVKRSDLDGYIKKL